MVWVWKTPALLPSQTEVGNLSGDLISTTHIKNEDSLVEWSP